MPPRGLRVEALEKFHQKNARSALAQVAPQEASQSGKKK
jgi:hypothetical protein